MKTALGTLLMFFAIACSAETPLTPEQRADQQVIDNLKRAGSDLSKPHPTDFYLYFPGELQARAASQELAASGFRLKRVDVAAKGQNWVVIASKAVVPGLPELTAISADLRKLAVRLSGEYDGWESAVTK